MKFRKKRQGASLLDQAKDGEVAQPPSSVAVVAVPQPQDVLLDSTTLSNSAVPVSDNDNNPPTPPPEQQLADQHKPAPQPSSAGPWNIGRTAPLAVVVLGIVASSLLLSFGISSARDSADDAFVDIARDVVERINQLWFFYIFLTSLIYEGCSSQDPNPREGLRRVYHHMVSLNIPFSSISCLPNVSHGERDAFEAETRQFVAGLNYTAPNAALYYRGFFETNATYNGVFRRQNSTFYVPLNAVEPRETGSFGLDYDMISPFSRQRAFVLQAFDTQRPVLTRRRRSDPGFEKYPPVHSYRIAVYHPGQPNTTAVDGRSKLGSTQIVIPQIFEWLHTVLPPVSLHVQLYLFDSSPDLDQAEFLGGAVFCNAHQHDGGSTTGEKGEATTTEIGTGSLRGTSSPYGRVMDDNNPSLCPNRVGFIPQPETSLSSVVSRKHHFSHVGVLPILNRQWTVVVFCDTGEAFAPDLLHLVVTSLALLAASLLLAGWLYTRRQREWRLARLTAQLEAEKTQLRLDAARETARHERELNDYIAHEVRNPLSAAISACSFVSTAVAEQQPLVTEEAQTTVREDVHTITTSLVFINDLLRNMLDMHRAESNEMKMIESLAGVRSDVLEPVAALLYRRDCNFDVTIDCSDELMIQTDKLRLKQIVLNLARNSAKFVERGFIRLGARDSDDGTDTAVLFVEDSGPGVPKEKRKHMFRKFQDSLDSLQQGTGVGLAVCRKLIDLLGGEIRLDEDYHSGIEGCPGARFVIQLPGVVMQHNMMSMSMPAAIMMDEDMDKNEDAGTSKTASTQSSKTLLVEQSQVNTVSESNKTGTASTTPKQDDNGMEGVPEDLTVLFVDDDIMLRKLFARSISRHLPLWTIHSASSGETACRMVAEQHYDIIFMDQYMASVDKQLLGTETVRALRATGVASRICGLSANDLEEAFLKAGANAFAIKPFPYQKQAIREIILRILGNDFVKKEREEATTSLGEEVTSCNGDDKCVVCEDPGKSEANEVMIVFSTGDDERCAGGQHNHNGDQDVSTLEAVGRPSSAAVPPCESG